MIKRVLYHFQIAIDWQRLRGTASFSKNAVTFSCRAQAREAINMHLPHLYLLRKSSLFAKSFRSSLKSPTTFTAITTKSYVYPV